MKKWLCLTDCVLRTSLRATRLSLGALSLGALGLGACSFSGLEEVGDKLESYEIPEVTEEWYGTAMLTVQEVLRALFPDLSDAEILEISTTLSFEEALALRAELEGARAVAAELTADLSEVSFEVKGRRDHDLSGLRGGFPEGLHVHGLSCQYDAARSQASVVMSGVFSGETPVDLNQASVNVFVDGNAQDGTLSCISSGETVDLVFLVDVTGSMGGVISAVRDSMVRFIDALEARGVQGTISVVSYQDSVGVNIPFQAPVTDLKLERSPFFAPVSLSDPDGVLEARSFVNRLEANRGADAPENLAGALDFARNNVIGSLSGAPNVVDGKSDAQGTAPFPELTSDRQLFIALTDSTFHSDNRDETNSSLQAGFVPREAEEILASLQQTGSVVHVIDPSWVDENKNPNSTGPTTDADYWAVKTGGVGDDKLEGYSITDLEVLITGEENGLLDVVLDGIVSTSCTYNFTGELLAESEVRLEIEAGVELFSEFVGVVSF